MNVNLSDLRWYLENGGREALRSKGLEVSETGEVRALPTEVCVMQFDGVTYLKSYPQAIRRADFAEKGDIQGF